MLKIESFYSKKDWASSEAKRIIRQLEKQINNRTNSETNHYIPSSYTSKLSTILLNAINDTDEDLRPEKLRTHPSTIYSNHDPILITACLETLSENYITILNGDIEQLVEIIHRKDKVSSSESQVRNCLIDIIFSPIDKVEPQKDFNENSN